LEVDGNDEIMAVLQDRDSNDGMAKTIFNYLHIIRSSNNETTTV